MTQSGYLVGTPGYMAPEQASGKRALVGPATDIYALGVVLYQLLTGQLPFKRDSTLELLRAVTYDEPARPRRLQPNLPRDLEAITLHCLEKEPTQRYASAMELADDLRRFQAGEAIAARPPSRMERMSKFVRRYKVAVGGAVATGVALVLGLVGTVIFAVGEARQRHELASEQAKVQARFDMAAKAIALFHTGVSEDMLLKNAEFKELRTKLLKEAAGFYADLEKLLAGQTDAKSRQALAAAYFELGELTHKIGDKKEALAVHRKALRDVDLAGKPRAGRQFALHDRAFEIVGDLPPQCDAGEISRRRAVVQSRHVFPTGAEKRHQSVIAAALVSCLLT